MMHNFPGRRPPSRNRRQRSGSGVDNKPFLRDLILLGVGQFGQAMHQGRQESLQNL